MAQRMRVRPGRAVWVGALAVFCGGLAGCLDADKDRRPTGPPPMAKGATGSGVVPGVGPNAVAGRTNPPGSAVGMNSNPYAPNTGSGITQMNGQFQPGYNGRPGPGYDPMAAANPNSGGMVPMGTPVRPTSPNAYGGSVVPPVGPSGSSQPPTAPAGLPASYPSSPGGPPTSGMTTSNSQYRGTDPMAPSLAQLDPLPPSPPVNSTAPPVGPVSPASAPVPPAAAPMFPNAPATYPGR